MTRAKRLKHYRWLLKTGDLRPANSVVRWLLDEVRRLDRELVARSKIVIAANPACVRNRRAT